MIRVVPANEATWADLQRVFGTRGQGARCQCQRYRLRPGETFAGAPVEERACRLYEQTNAGDPEATETSGLVAYFGDEPVGWCAVGPRPSYEGLVRRFRVPWDGRDEDRADPGVWAVTCIFPTFLSLASRNVNESHRGRATALVITVSYLGYLFGPVYVGLWSQGMGLRGAMLAVAALSGVLFILTVPMLRLSGFTWRTEAEAERAPIPD